MRNLSVLSIFFVISSVYSQICHQCGVRYPPMIQKRYNFNFDQFFNGKPNRFSSYVPSQPSQRVLNMYGQDAETFGSEIGKSIAQRIQQAYVSKQDPDYNFQFSSPSASTSLATSPTSSDQTDGYTSPVQFPSTVSTSSTNWPSTHPPEELPTLQQAYQQPQQQYSSYGPLSTHSTTTPQISPIQTQSSAGFGALPGLLPPSNGQQGCAWCGGGYRDKRNGGDDVGKEQEKKVQKV